MQTMTMNLRSIVVLFILIITCLASFSQTREELEKRRKEIQQEIQDLQRAQSEISKDKKAGLSQLKLIEKKLRSRYAVIDNLNEEMKMIDNTIFNDNREIYRLQKELDTLRKQYARTVEYAYKNRSSYDMLNFIFSATSFNDAVRRVSYLKTYRQYREEQVGKINRTQKDLSGKINTLTQDKKEKGKVLLEQNKQKEILESEKKEKNQFVSKLKSREKEIEKEMAAKRKIERSLQSSIAAIVKREIEAARKKAEEDAKRSASSAVTKTVETKSSSVATAAASTRKVNVLENTPEGN